MNKSDVKWVVEAESIFTSKDSGKLNYIGKAIVKLNINGKEVELLPNKTLTLIDDKGDYEITNTIDDDNE